MPDITITLTDTQLNSLKYSCLSPQEWIENASFNRARISQEEIIAKLVEHCNSNSIAIATGAEAQVAQAYELGVVDTAENVRNANIAESSE
jgi:hypothetical protein